MKINSVLVFLLLWFSVVHAQDKEPWKRISSSNTIQTAKGIDKSGFIDPILFQLDEEALQSKLKLVQDKVILSSNLEITVPNAKGVLEKFAIREASNFESELQAKYPNIRSYFGTGITDPTAILNFSMSSLGIQTMITRSGNQMEFIEKYSENEDAYVVFDSKDKLKEALPFSCTTTNDESISNKKRSNPTAKLVSSNKEFRTLRLALSCTGEYAQYHKKTADVVSDALAAINATITRVNGIFNRDLAVKLLLIANNDQIIYTDAATDPYSPSNIGVGSKTVAGKWGSELQTTLTNTIGNANYDIGHLFGATGGGGNAGCIGCVCDPGKGSAYTSPSNGIPKGDVFDIDFVAHEMGHQLGANHTFSFDLEGVGVSVEPGSGSTIMGYAGITDYDVEIRSGDYFSFASISQIQTNLATKSCPITTTINANAPTVNAGADYTIPKGTAFVLKGTGGSSTATTYVWEQNDSATSASGDSSIALSTKTNGPLFRSFPPVNNPVRYMPSFENVLAGRLTSSWESVSTVERTLHFVLTARDNAAEGLAQTISDEMLVNVSGTAGPFEVTSQNIENLSWFQSTEKIITWNVNGTNALPGSSKVNIKLSTDNGVSFPIVLASAVANDGSETIVVPNVSSQFCRILIEPTDNIFYAINSKTFAIGYTAESSCQTFNFITTPFAIPEQGNFVSKTIIVPETDSFVSNISVNVDITHSYLSDVQMELVSPKGTVVKLFYNGCTSTNGRLLLNYDDAGGSLSCGNATLQTVAPLGVLSNFNGENPQGAWTLRIRDVFINDTGVLNAASIAICTKDYTLVSYEEINKDLRVSSISNDENFNVKYTSVSASDTIEIVVYDINGKRLFDKKYPNNGNFNQDIRLMNKPEAGVYFVHLIDGGTKKTSKIIIK